MTDEKPNPSDSDEDKRQPTPNGLNAFDTLYDYLVEDNWHPTRLGDPYVYSMQYAGKNAHLNCYAYMRVDLEQLLIYAIAPVKTPEHSRAALAEFLTRANYGLRIGNFEMDYSDGEIRYKSSLDFDGTTLAAPMIRTALYPAVQTMDRYMPGILRVMFGGSTPVEAIMEVENNAS